MPIRKNLLTWQREGYAANHQTRFNIIIHVLTVPVTWASLFIMIAALARGSTQLFFLGGGLILIPLIGQGLGHKREKVPPVPFLGPIDFVSRFFAEQFVTFPVWFFCKWK